MTSPTSFCSPVVAGLVPYVPGEQPAIANLIKLNTNENPYPPSPKALAAIRGAAEQGLQLYPDPESSALRRSMAGRHGLEPAQVFVGNGSDEVLAHAFFAFFAFFQQPGCPLMLSDISYSFYEVYCGLYGIPMDIVPLAEGLVLDVYAFARDASAPVAGVVVANPNAPTGRAISLAEVEVLLRLHPQRVVLVDEAYVDFGAESALALVPRYPNLLVVQTLSKSRSLAGLRVGFACGQAHLIDALNRVKNSFNSYPLDRLAQAGALAALEDEAYFETTRQAVIHTREGLALQLEDLGFEVLPSRTNFLFVRHPGHDAAPLAAALRAVGILVRHFRTPRIAQYLRISIGTPAQCDALVAALQRILAA